MTLVDGSLLGHKVSLNGSKSLDEVDLRTYLEGKKESYYYNDVTQPDRTHPGIPISFGVEARFLFADHDIGQYENQVREGAHYCEFDFYIEGSKNISGGQIYVSQKINANFVVYTDTTGNHISDLKTQISGMYVNTMTALAKIIIIDARDDMFPILLTDSYIEIANKFSLFEPDTLNVYIKYNFRVRHFLTDTQ